ncbi:PIN domain-containing protein [Candidatus Peregrinibacteria bacterium]|nr:MAG: PIN domain-containing protein [Candidatus Peregrinibacteria bacterium]
MKEILVDSSVYVSSFFLSERYCNESKDFFRCIFQEQYRLALPISALFEIIHACFRRSGNLDIEQSVLGHLLQLSQRQLLRVIPLEAEFSAHYFASHAHYDLKTADSIIAVMAEAEEVPLISWDTQLNRTASKKIHAYTPTQFLALHGKKA